MVEFRSPENDEGRMFSRHNIAENEKEHKAPPRLGRRESEPHSHAISYLHDVLDTNFPKDRVMWDLHHYFHIQNGKLQGTKLDLQFDISFFRNFNLPEKLPSYDSANYKGRVPDLVINILSKSTWRKDLIDNMEFCHQLKIPVYAVFFAYPVAPRTFPLPFLRVYKLKDDGSYQEHELKEIMYKKGKIVDDANFINLKPYLPFGIALEKISDTYLGGKDIYQAIIININTKQKYPTRYESQKSKAEKEKKRAEKEKKRADKLRKEIEKLKKK